MADIDDLIDALVVAAQGVTAAMEQGCWSKSDDRELEAARDAIRAELAQARAERDAAREAHKQAGEQVLKIVRKALAGYEPDYKISINGSLYTQWGLVEKDIRAALPPAGGENDPA